MNDKKNIKFNIIVPIFLLGLLLIIINLLTNIHQDNIWNNGFNEGYDKGYYLMQNENLNLNNITNTCLDWNNTINTINKNCGGTHITKKHNDNNWYIFKHTHKEGWMKMEYILVEECILNEN